MLKQWLAKMADTKWPGVGELWLDPEGNRADFYDCELNIKTEGIYYTWNYEDKTNNGSFIFNDNGAKWSDSWHQPIPVQCINVPDSWSLFTINNTYDVPSSPSWGWQSKLSKRPDGVLVLQMTNIAPWGEEGRAVRMIFTSPGS